MNPKGYGKVIQAVNVKGSSPAEFNADLQKEETPVAAVSVTDPGREDEVIRKGIQTGRRLNVDRIVLLSQQPSRAGGMEVTCRSLLVSGAGIPAVETIKVAKGSKGIEKGSS